MQENTNLLEFDVEKWWDYFLEKKNGLISTILLKRNKKGQYIFQRYVIHQLEKSEESHYRVTIPFTRKPLLAKALYHFYDSFRSLNYEKGLYLSCD